MFFWGSYNFQASQQGEHPDRPALRYPVYVPPSPSMLSAVSDGAAGLLDAVSGHRLSVSMVACGSKHMVVVAGLVPAAGCDCDDDVVEVTNHSGAVLKDEKGNVAKDSRNVSDADKRELYDRWLLYGMGSNHHGQLGNCVPEYSTSLTRLQFEKFLPSGSQICSVACGYRHTLISTTCGKVFSAGNNSFSQLGTNAKVGGFTLVHGVANIKRVFAAGNVSFALDEKGRLYSWGEAQYGHLCHGDDGERMDPATLKAVKTNVSIPTLIQWFVRHRVTIVDVSVGPTHVVCSSSDEVYTCGDGRYGKLGTGGIGNLLLPRRVEFPKRAHPERLCGISAGDDQTFVLRESPAVGSVVYHFGRMNDTDGRMLPTVIELPSSIYRVFSGRGSFAIGVTREGSVHVWGRHMYAGVSSGAPAASLSKIKKVTSLEPYKVTNAAIGGTFVVVFADSIRTNIDATGLFPNGENRWDVVVPHDDRDTPLNQLKNQNAYECSVGAFLTQYLGPSLAPAYIKGIPPAPPLTDFNKDMFVPIGAHGLTVGQKVRIWMTDVYALGTVEAVLGRKTGRSGADGVKNEYNEEDLEDLEKNDGYRVLIEWQRDDWHNEEITLYSEDETLDNQNPNRWQPLWFLRDTARGGDYVVNGW
ncbi:putative Regulator of chromosome condensation (RCC1) repeat [Trypanosoma vivax]|uniref:Regulator of chromosome condensation n=1 Tax=Trypanosoma vivax (strain Y486) TaxID=1055687 RepID=G0UCS5_TRYVY|nr:hypothetical protein TRVL_00362 [Trypanosoma vivax]KAH8608121.1 putative Regulator of chromosome condensation (RCC1) repeat [Trypanosoma vivax]CCC53635.1 conserved hypothetical protein [Trypanosoma vivax Y486]